MAHLSCTYCLWDTQKVSGTILNSKVALTACRTSLTGARHGSREGRLANNVIVMAFVISISRRVLKHRALNGGISVNLGHNTLPINPSTYAYCWPGCLSLITFRQQNRGYTNDPFFHKVTATTVVTRKYEMKQISETSPADQPPECCFRLVVQWAPSKEGKSVYH